MMLTTTVAVARGVTTGITIRVAVRVAVRVLIRVTIRVTIRVAVRVTIRVSSKQKMDCPRKQIANTVTKPLLKPYNIKSAKAAITARDGLRVCNSVTTLITLS
jgi:hypothetical protein